MAMWYGYSMLRRRYPWLGSGRRPSACETNRLSDSAILCGSGAPKALVPKVVKKRPDEGPRLYKVTTPKARGILGESIYPLEANLAHPPWGSAGGSGDILH